MQFYILSQVESEMIAMRKTQSVSERSLETGWLTRQDLRPLGVCLGRLREVLFIPSLIKAKSKNG